MKDFCVWFVAISSIFFGSCYVFQIWRRRAAPTISTWIIFLVGCGLSFITYIGAENHDIKSGILNTIDLVYISLILLAIILWGRHEVRFKPFEKWYLAGVAGIVLYGVVTNNLWNSNILTQVLMSIAYIPMFHKFITSKKNTESFFGWVPGIFNGLVALYPAIHGGNVLAVIYVSRSFIFSVVTVLLMLYYKFKKPKA